MIRLGDPQPANFSPLYKGQVLVHGMGFSPDHKTLAVVSIGSNSVTFIDTGDQCREAHDLCRTLAARGLFHAGRQARSGSPCAARTTSPFSTAKTFEEKTRITAPAGPGMQIFSPDGKYGYVCSSFNPETDGHYRRRPRDRRAA